jgi:short-subunit dehydrogenase
MMDYYKHKTILITGAASGIGKRFAERVSDTDGVRLILWDLSSEALNKAAEQLRDHCAVDTSIINITDANRVELEAERLIKQNWIPDLILNCAGIVAGKLFQNHKYHEIDKTLQVNVSGSMYVVRAFLNKMIERGSGHIVNMASASGYIGNPKMSVYAASKWAVLGWTESLYLEMKQNKTGIDITVVIPSYIDTGMFEGVKAPLLTPILTTEDIVDRMLKGIAKRKRSIKAPFMVRFTPLLKGILPAKLFDWIAGRVFGVYETMDSFKGREEN